MLRRDAMVRAGLVSYYELLIRTNKTHVVDPIAYANIPWVVAHLALQKAYDENDTPDTKIDILKKITCFNRGLLHYLIQKKNRFTY